MTEETKSEGLKINGVQFGRGLVLFLLAVLIVGVNLLTGGRIEAPRAVVHARLESGAAAEPYIFFDVPDGAGGEDASVGFPLRLKGLLSAAEGESPSASRIDSMMGLAAPSAPVLIVMGPDEQITRIAASAWPSVGDGIRDRTIDELAAIAFAIDPEADHSAIRDWLAEVISAYAAGGPQPGDELVKRRGFGDLGVNITLNVGDAVTERGVREGIRVSMGLVP